MPNASLRKKIACETPGGFLCSLDRHCSPRRRLRDGKDIPEPQMIRSTSTTYTTIEAKALLACLTRSGRRGLAQRLLAEAAGEASRRLKLRDPGQLLVVAISNSRPLIGLTTRRIEGATYQVPAPLPMKQGTALAAQAILKCARQLRGKTTPTKLAKALVAAYRGELPPADRAGSASPPEKPRKVARLSARLAYGSDSD